MREIGICLSRLPSQLASSISQLTPEGTPQLRSQHHLEKAAAEAAARCLGKDRVEFLCPERTEVKWWPGTLRDRSTTILFRYGFYFFANLSCPQNVTGS
jgi:hypothetical protein